MIPAAAAADVKDRLALRNSRNRPCERKRKTIAVGRLLTIRFSIAIDVIHDRRRTQRGTDPYAAPSASNDIEQQPSNLGRPETPKRQATDSAETFSRKKQKKKQLPLRPLKEAPGIRQSGHDPMTQLTARKPSPHASLLSPPLHPSSTAAVSPTRSPLSPPRAWSICSTRHTPAREFSGHALPPVRSILGALQDKATHKIRPSRGPEFPVSVSLLPPSTALPIVITRIFQWLNTKSESNAKRAILLWFNVPYTLHIYISARCPPGGCPSFIRAETLQ